MKKGMNFWDVLAWIALGIIIIWIFLKMLGLINTPIWIEYAPVWSGIYVAGWGMSTLMRATQEISKMQANLSFLNRKITEHDKNIEFIREKCK